MRCAVHISHLNSVKNHLYYYDTVSVNGEFFCHVTYKVCERTKNFLGIVPNSTSILIKGLMCVAVEFSFAPKRTKVRERVKNFLGIAPNSTSILIKGLMCVAVGFSFAPKRTKVRERVKKILRECAATLN